MTSLKNMIGKRYNSLEDIKKEMEKITGQKVVSMIFADTDPEEFEPQELDNMIDYELKYGEVQTLYYLCDNAGRILITEV